MIQSFNAWDACPIAAENGAKLFGNANIGNLNLTSLSTPGQFSYGTSTAFVQRWYARTDFHPQVPAAWARITENIVLTFIVGHRITWRLSLAELFARRPREDAPFHARDPWFVEVPARQWFNVSVDRFGPAVNAEWDVFVAGEGLLAPTHLWQGPPVPKFWLHFEGVEAEGDDLIHLRRELARRMRAYQSAEDNIADYILSLAQGADESTLGTLNAVRDGILDGRYRGLASEPLLTPASNPLPIEE